MSSRFRLGGKKSDKKKSEGEGEGDGNGNGDSNMDQPEVPSRAWMKHLQKIPPAVSSMKAQRIIVWYRLMVVCHGIMNWVEMEKIARCKDEEKKARLKAIRENNIKRQLAVREQQQQMALRRIHQDQLAQTERILQEQLHVMTSALQGGIIDTLNGAAVQQTLQTQQELGQVTEQRDEEATKRAKAEKEKAKAEAEVKRLEEVNVEYEILNAQQAVLAEAEHEALEKTTDQYNTLNNDATRNDEKAKSLCQNTLKKITVHPSFYEKNSYPLYKFFMKHNKDAEGVGQLPPSREEAQKFINEFIPDSDNVFEVLGDAIDIQQWITNKLNENHKLIVSHYQSMNKNDRKLGGGNLATQLLRGALSLVPGAGLAKAAYVAAEATNAAVNGKQAFAGDSAIQNTIKEAKLYSDAC